jgi:multiple sugar transport system substrate-binding protein
VTQQSRLSRRALLGAGLGAVAAAGLSACGSSGSSSSGAKTTGASKKGTINVAFFGTQTQANAASAMADPFRKANPGYDVIFTGTNGTDWNDFFSKLLTQIAAGHTPDVIQVASEGSQLFASKNLVVPLDKYIQRDAEELKPYFADVYPSLVEGLMYQGHLYTLPTDFNAGNMFFDVPLLTKAGLDVPPASWTLDDFHAMASKLTRGSTVGFDWIVRLWGSWTSFMYANDANLLAGTKYPGGDWLWNTFYPNDPAAKGRHGGWDWSTPTANSPGVVEALDYVIQLKQAGLSPSPDIGGGGTLQGLFASNRIGMTLGGGFWAGGLKQAGMKYGQFDVQYFPKWKVQKALFGTGGYTLSATSKDKDLAWELLKSLTNPEAMDVIAIGNTTTPARRSMVTASRYSATGPPHWQVFYDTLTEFPNTMPIPTPPYYNALANSLNARTTQAMASGNAKAALDGMQSDLESAASQST